jgi:hypothetical protein
VAVLPPAATSGGSDKPHISLRYECACHHCHHLQKIGRKVDMLCSGRESENRWQWWQAQITPTFNEVSAKKSYASPARALADVL